MSKDDKQTINNFLQDSIKQLEGGQKVVSFHIDDLDIDLPNVVNDQVKKALDLYTLLLDSYSEMSAEYSAVLRIAIGYTSQLNVAQLDDLMANKLELTSPPELILKKRAGLFSPFVAEEHTFPIEQSLIDQKQGCVYAYFRSIRFGSDDMFAPAFYFEHFPEGQIEFDW